MTNQEIKEYYQSQIDFYTRQLEQVGKMLQYCELTTERELKRSKELTKHVWDKGSVTEIEMEIWPADGSYRNNEWKEADRERRKYYRDRKKDKNQIEKYTKLLQDMEAQK
jgi:hypothetical protein